MMRLEPHHWKATADKMTQDFYNLYFKEILGVLGEYSVPRVNNKEKKEPTAFEKGYVTYPGVDFPSHLVNPLERAIREGRVTYHNGEFRGAYNIGISKELKKFAVYDERSKTWKGKPPVTLQNIINVVNHRNEQKAAKIKEILDRQGKEAEKKIQQLEFPFADTLQSLDRQARSDVESLTILPDLPEKMKERIYQTYTERQQDNIRNWTPEQIGRIRSVIEEQSLRGLNMPELRKRIEAEFEVSANKASFLAQQETSLFLSKFRAQRYGEADVTEYKWSDSHDRKVRHDHHMLHGKRFTFGNPPVVDIKTGRRGEPGEDFRCRCIAIPILPK